MRLADGQLADLTRSFRWRVDGGTWDGVRVIHLDAFWNEVAVARYFAVDMADIAAFRFPEAALEEIVLRMQDQVIEFVERYG